MSYKLADTAEKAKNLVTVTGLSEASAEGDQLSDGLGVTCTPCVIE